MERHSRYKPASAAEEMNLRKRSTSKSNRTLEKFKENGNVTIGDNNNKIAKRKKSTDLHEEELKLVIQDIKIQRIRDNIKKLETETIRRMTEQLTALVDGVLGDLDRFDDNKDDRLFGREVINERRTKDRNNVKVFIARASPLSELLEVRHLRSLYHMFIAGLIIAIGSGILGDTLSGGWRSINIGVRHVPAAFQNFNKAIVIWIGMFISACLVYPLFKIWVNVRTLTKAGSWMRWLWDRACILFFLIGAGEFMVSVVLLFGPNMGPASAAILLLEQARLLMKSHAFVRTNASRFLKTTNEQELPKFTNYLYFLFAPTLIYRDQYPYTSHIRWDFVASCFVEFFGGILMLSCIMELNILPEFNSFGMKTHTSGTLVASIFRTILPASMFTLCGFYLFLHAWMNAWAEMLQFADRRFYGAWWNATSYGEYYRTWNTVVHDYLHTYIYQDVHILTGNKIAARWAVFAVSALVHEWIIAFMLGFCYPVMFIQFFGIGSVLGFIRSATGKSRAANIFLWCSLACGLGLQISLYSMEAFARINCPTSNQEFIDYFIPKSWTCNGLQNS